MKIRNRRAKREFFIEDTYEAGIKLQGTEVKSLRMGRGSIKGAYAKIEKGEVFIYGMNIPRYDHASRRTNHDPERPRKLLLRKKQIQHLIGKTERKGYTLVPITLYFKNGHAKIELGLGKRKDRQDKRDEIKKREAERKMRRSMQHPQ